MTRLINKAVVTGGSSGVGLAAPQEFMKSLINILIRSVFSRRILIIT